MGSTTDSRSRHDRYLSDHFGNLKSGKAFGAKGMMFWRPATRAQGVSVAICAPVMMFVSGKP